MKEPNPFSPIWYSPKFKGPDVRYGEVALSIKGGDIVHMVPTHVVLGPTLAYFAYFSFTSCCQEKWLKRIGDTEVNLRKRISVDYVTRRENSQNSRARACQETVNKRFKQFGCLK
jgi:hypothetical protein